MGGPHTLPFLSPTYTVRPRLKVGIVFIAEKVIFLSTYFGFPKEFPTGFLSRTDFNIVVVAAGTDGSEWTQSEEYFWLNPVILHHSRVHLTILIILHQLSSKTSSIEAHVRRAAANQSTSHPLIQQ